MLTLVALLVIIAAVIVFAASRISSCSQEAQQAAEFAHARVSFIAVGDNLPDYGIGDEADAKAGGMDDGTYDYHFIFEHIAPYSQAADLAYIKQETHVGGDGIGPKGYPSFNTTDEMADAVVDAGFDFVASASNHSYDWGYYGALTHSCEVWAEKPVQFTGTARSQEEADRIATITCKGITFALLDYTYGVNGCDVGEDFEPYEINLIDEDRIRADVARAKEVSDVVIVAMHWGTENQTEPDDDQLYYAQLLADLDVDLVLGSHPHVIGPLSWVQGADGHRTLVAYSLGNFVSNHETPDPLNELEGMLSCEFVRDNDIITIENVEWIPLVNHTEEGVHTVYALPDYKSDIASRHIFLTQLDDPVGWLGETSNAVVNSLGDDFAIRLPQKEEKHANNAG
ncbi:MAG: CapA family protein [Eggerthellaceae bacterium]|nr:CapA family protein [Eggerthellaceae bacterium]